MWEKTLWVGMGGFIGANARYWIGGWIAQRLNAAFPYETLIINVSGSFLLGLFMTLALQFPWHPRWRGAVAIGVLGGYTTFSTYTYESLKLLEEERWLAAGLNMLGSVVLGMTAVWLGVVVGRFITRGLS